MRARRPSRTGADRSLFVLTVAIAAALVAVAVTADRGVPGAPAYHLRVTARDFSNLGAGDDVRIAGRRVGEVSSADVRRGRAVVRLALDVGLRPLPADTEAAIRSKGLLGSRFLELIPGRSPDPLREGATVGEQDTSATPQLADVLSSFDPVTRQRLESFVAGAGRGFAGRGSGLNATLGTLPRLLPDLRNTATAVLARDGAARRFAPSLNDAAGAFDVSREDFAAGFEPQTAGLTPIADSKPAARALLETAPGALAGTRAGLARSAPLLDEATALSAVAARSLAPAPAALHETQALLAESREPLRRAVPLLDRLRAAAGPTIGLTRRVTPVLSPLTRGLDDTRPPLDEVTPRACDLTRLAATWRSMLEFGTPGGGELGPLNVFRITFVDTPESLGAARQNSGVIGENAYPAPCEAGSEPAP